ncbi:MAG: IclR family transcriptional regulator [Myxococcota bacterium]|nr:IclR family transcriptional regulator [Myxococcota bacterium]
MFHNMELNSSEFVMQSLASIDKAIEILFYLRGVPAGCGVTSIGRALDMPKSSVHRLLSALLRRGLVEQTEAGRYRSGVGLRALGLGGLDQAPLVVGGHPVLEEVASGLGETLFLVGARAGVLHVLDKVEGQGFLRASPQIGSEVPVHATAVGKIFLAFSGKALKDEGVQEREAFTEATLVEPEKMRAELERIRQSGVAWNQEEWIPGLFVVAAPVWLTGRMLGAVAIALPSSRRSDLGVALLEKEVRKAADRIGGRLSGQEVGAMEGESRADV